MNKELLKALVLAKYIVIGVIAATLAHWILGKTDIYGTFLIGFVITLAVDFIDEKYDD